MASCPVGLMSCFSLETAAATITGSRLFQVHYDEFIPQFEKQYPEFPWSGVQVSLGLRQAGAMETTLFPGWAKTTPPTYPTPAVLWACVVLRMSLNRREGIWGILR